ncbi:MAG: prenyltransferase/squalene oxidase repeat-containing protein [bacterium]
MNDQDFILALEEYFDGTLTPEMRAAFGSELSSNPERRRLFEEQARQHIRLHAQTSKIDFTESQHIAMMVMDIVEKGHEPARFSDILHDQTLQERFRAIRKGLRAPRGSNLNRYARFALLRLFGPPTFSVAVSTIVVLLLMFVWVPKIMRPEPEEYTVTQIDLAPSKAPPVLDPTPIPPAPTPEKEPPTITFSPTPSRDPEPPATPPLPPLPPVSTAPNAPLVPLRPLAPTGLPPGFIGRTDGERERILKETPESERTEKGVAGALKWLHDHQLENGSWAGQDPVAMTGLALLAYLAHGETPGTGRYSETVTKGLKYLLATQDARGAYAQNVYAHAIATYAMAEACTLTRIGELRASMEKAVQVIIQGQQDAGGFDYQYSKGARFDTSVSGWQIQALKAAALADPAQPSLDAALAKSVLFLQREAFARDGSGFVYEGKNGIPSASGAKWTMTGVGTLGLQILGKPHAAQARLGLKALRDVTFDWLPGTKPGVYGYYYVTQAKFQQENRAAWQEWNLQMVRALLKNQHTDGHWENGDYDQGSHVYTTTLCALMLEVYYRYLPTFEKAPEKPDPTGSQAGDVSVDVQ